MSLRLIADLSSLSNNTVGLISVAFGGAVAGADGTARVFFFSGLSLATSIVRPSRSVDFAGDAWPERLVLSPVETGLDLVMPWTTSIDSPSAVLLACGVIYFLCAAPPFATADFVPAVVRAG